MAFKRGAAKAQAKGKKKSRFAGTKSAGERTPQPGVGTYVCEFVSSTLSYESGEWFKCFAKIVEIESDGREKGDPGEGDEILAMLTSVAGKARNVGYPKVKNLAMALAGYDNDSEYDDEFDPDAVFVEHVLNDEDCDHLDENGEEYGDLAGTLFRLKVTRGKQVMKDGVDTGDYYRNVHCSPYTDDEDS